MKNTTGNSNLKQVIYLVILMLGIGLITNAQTPNEPQSLLPNQTLEREMKGGEIHSYKITLKVGEYFHVDVNQNDIDVLLAVIGEDGKILVERDRPNGKQGLEALSFIALSAGKYRFEVKALEVKAEAGKYVITSQQPRTPTATDKKRIDAETLLQDGQRLSQTRTKESVTEACAKYEAAAVLWREVGDKYAEALTQTNLGFGRESLDGKEQAIIAHDRALLLYRELRDKANEASSLSALCVLNGYVEKPDLAIEQYRQAKAIFRELKDDNGEKALNERFDKVAEAYLNVGDKLAKKKEAQSYREAIKFYSIMGKMYRELENKKNEALALFLLGEYK